MTLLQMQQLSRQPSDYGAEILVQVIKTNYYLDNLILEIIAIVFVGEILLFGIVIIQLGRSCVRNKPGQWSADCLQN